MREILTADELDAISDEGLVMLIVERADIDEDAAREALAIIRDDPSNGSRHGHS